jgi:hypothetical protein
LTVCGHEANVGARRRSVNLAGAAVACEKPIDKAIATVNIAAVKK